MKYLLYLLEEFDCSDGLIFYRPCLSKNIFSPNYNLKTKRDECHGYQICIRISSVDVKWNRNSIYVNSFVNINNKTEIVIKCPLFSCVRRVSVQRYRKTYFRTKQTQVNFRGKVSRKVYCRASWQEFIHVLD